MIRDANILVVGGGMAGFSAAMAAAQENKKIILVERMNQLGGNATNSNVGTICGSYYRTFQNTPKLVGYKFCKDFMSYLLLNSDKNKLINYHNGLFIISYDWEFLANYIEQQLIQAGVEIRKEATVTGIRKEGSGISRLTLSQNNNSEELTFENIIDCSGNGIIAQLAGLEMISSSSYQAASQVFRVKNISSDNEFSLNMALKKEMMQLEATDNQPTSVSIIPGSLKENKADFKLTIPHVITDAVGLDEQLVREASKSVNEIFSHLTKKIIGLKNGEIEFIFPQPGIRVQQRSKGKKILSEDDVMTCKKVNDGIAIGTWPIEEWDANGKVNLQYFEADDGYMISADCLQSSAVENLYFAGKNISATTKAVASARVIGTCIQTGYAAGKLACCKNTEEKEKMIISLNKELISGND